ncbi:hypothetical protein HPP92_000975 [Vanilla planifolia]|uniref:Uncharacterized protein n=1 Tax=Vanilla planifolia TaxID=51239 RepID=A0A835VD51_VANPL|nr:hypothetical protein HPP92_000975 [Vanilla planifolia]
MLTKRSRSTNTNKPGMVTNRRNLSIRAIASLFPSKSFFAGFPAKFFQYLDAPHKSSNFLLQIMPLSAIRNLSSKKPTETKRQPWGCRDSKPVGLSIVDALGNENAHERSSKSDNRIVLLGSQLKVQIPSTSQKSVFPNRAMDCTHSRAEFCGRNKKSLLDAILLSPARRSLLATPGPNSEPSALPLCK